VRHPKLVEAIGGYYDKKYVFVIFILIFKGIEFFLLSVFSFGYFSFLRFGFLVFLVVFHCLYCPSRAKRANFSLLQQRNYRDRAVGHQPVPVFANAQGPQPAPQDQDRVGHCRGHELPALAQHHSPRPEERERVAKFWIGHHCKSIFLPTSFYLFPH
jgi:hypothetical protein